MRSQYTQTIRDGNGNIVGGAIVTVKLAGTSSPANIYAAATGGSPLPNSQVTAAANGYYGFFVDPVDYPSYPLFDIYYSTSNPIQNLVSPTVYSGIQVFPFSTITFFLPGRVGGMLEANKVVFDGFTFGVSRTVSNLFLSVKAEDMPVGGNLTAQVTKNQIAQTGTAAITAGGSTYSPAVAGMSIAFSSTDQLGIKIIGVGGSFAGAELSWVVTYA